MTNKQTDPTLAPTACAPPPTDGASELRRFLELGAAQLDAALRESDRRVDELAGAIGSVVSDAHELGQQISALNPTDAASLERTRARINLLTESLNTHVATAITSLQFYDKLVQRLTHVRDGLAIPADCTADVSARAAPDWKALLEQVRARYSMVEERVLFDFMMRGLSAEQMLKALTGLRASASSGELETF